jgi:hypothetical protein
MKSSRRTVSIARPSRSERRSPRRPSSAPLASRSRRRPSSPLTGWLGGGMTHPLTTTSRSGESEPTVQHMRTCRFSATSRSDVRGRCGGQPRWETPRSERTIAPTSLPRAKRAPCTPPTPTSSATPPWTMCPRCAGSWSWTARGCSAAPRSSERSAGPPQRRCRWPTGASSPTHPSRQASSGSSCACAATPCEPISMRLRWRSACVRRWAPSQHGGRTPKRRPTSNANAQKARPTATPSAASNATSPTASGTSSSRPPPVLNNSPNINLLTYAEPRTAA